MVSLVRRLGQRVVSPDQVVWRHRPPRRAAVRLGWNAAGATLILAPAWLLFGDEPWTVESGAVNPLALLIPGLGVIFGCLLAVPALGLVRRPIVSADHYALTVRPGIVRTLVLPWAQLVELAAVPVDDEPMLLVRCGPRQRHSGDWPRWWDRAELRAARRARRSEAISSYHLAVPMNDFAGRPSTLLTTLTSLAPGHVTLVDRLS
ncbi:MAG: hypothetical protein ACM30G_12445 [Micromonosporaceae bacterium]